MQPVGKVPARFQLGPSTFKEDLHIYREVTGVLLSWRVSKGLHILPECYPQPLSPPGPSAEPHRMAINGSAAPENRARPPTSQSMMMEFPTVFDGQIKNMEGELFHISLTDDAKPFCVNTPRAIPIAYRDKLRAEFDLLQKHGS